MLIKIIINTYTQYMFALFTKKTQKLLITPSFLYTQHNIWLLVTLLN